MGWSPKLTMVNHGATQWICSRITVIVMNHNHPDLCCAQVLQENYPRARRCLDVYCVAQPQVEPGDEQSIHILNELYYGTRPSVYFKHLQTLQKTLASLDRFQDVFNVFEINHSFTVSTSFKRLSMLLPTSRLLALLEPKPQALGRWDFALSFCHILVRFAVHDIHIYEHEMWWREVVTICYLMCLLV